ncbi:unnamed protein product [Ostreobium quekettii]|uniref:Uncharacterized protein n=1 Tax=Ostreobium quekettii TaxID=121088 RepID=A0A8S1IZZ7_9CHLO|nr:unnamed protein product [Ostreobium quekettii]
MTKLGTCSFRLQAVEIAFLPMHGDCKLQQQLDCDIAALLFGMSPIFCLHLPVYVIAGQIVWLAHNVQPVCLPCCSDCTVVHRAARCSVVLYGLLKLSKFAAAEHSLGTAWAGQ